MNIFVASPAKRAAVPETEDPFTVRTLLDVDPHTEPGQLFAEKMILIHWVFLLFFNPPLTSSARTARAACPGLPSERREVS